MSKPGHVGRPVNKRQQFFNNEQLAPNNSGFQNDSDVLNFIRKPNDLTKNETYNQQRNQAGNYFYNGILIPERQQAFQDNPLTPFSQDEVTQLAGAMPIGNAPIYLGLSNSMTPTQQRTAIASGALNSNDPRYKDPESLKHYQSLAFNTIKDPSQITDVEKQFSKGMSGSDPTDNTVGGFLSALYHGIQQHLAGIQGDYTPKPSGPAGNLPDYGYSQSTFGSSMTGAEGGGD